MKMRLSLGIIGLCKLGSGCNLVDLSAHNVAYETRLCTDTLREGIRNRRLANAAWNDVQIAGPGQVFSKDYVQGFKDGFADYLDGGATETPPPLPARHYWATRYQTPQGHQAINDWYAGCQYGVAAAQASGHRRWLTLPPSAPAGDGVAVPPQLSATEGSPQATGE